MKKIVSILLVAILCISSFTLTASAAGKSINFNTLPEDTDLVIHKGETITMTDTVKIASLTINRGGILILDGAHLIIDGDLITAGIVKATEKGGNITASDDVYNYNIMMNVNIVCDYIYNVGTFYQCSCESNKLLNENVIGECNLKGKLFDTNMGAVYNSNVNYEKYSVSSVRTYQYKITPSTEYYAPGTVVPISWMALEDHADEINFISWEVINLFDDSPVEVDNINSSNASFVMPNAPVSVNAVCSDNLSGDVYLLGTIIDENYSSGDGWSYNLDTQVLTFDDFVYEGNAQHEDFDFGHVLFSDIDEITVTGNAKIKISVDDEDWYNNYIFASNGNIVFDNADIEIITECGVGIDSYKNIEIINNSNIKINAGTACSDEAIYALDDIIISDSTVKATSVGFDDPYGSGGDDAFDAGRDIILTNAVVEATSTGDGFDALRNVIINDSKVIVKSLFDNNEGGTLGNEGIEARLIEINGDSIINCCVDDKGLWAPEIYINGGKIILDGAATDTPYPAIDGILYYNGGSVELKSHYFAASYPIQIGESVKASILTSENYDGANADFNYDTMSFLNCKYIWLNSIEGTVDTVKSGTKLSKVAVDGTLSGIEGSFQWINPDEKVEETGNYLAIFVPDEKGIAPIRVSVEVVVCSHICHNDSFIARTFWGIIKPMLKLFNIQKNCECGASHF